KLMSRLMQERGIKHTTSECTLRGFTCSSANVDPKTATPAEIARARKIQTGNQVDGITGGLAVKDADKPEKHPLAGQRTATVRERSCRSFFRACLDARAS